MENYKGSISVVIPNWNDAEHIPLIIENYIHQTRPPIEIIIVDDASTDNSRDIIRAFQVKYPQVKLHCLEENLGPCLAVQIGLNLVTSEYVALTSANDSVEKEFLEKSVKVLEQNLTAGMCFSDSGELSEDGLKKASFSWALSKTPHFFAPNELKAELRKRSFTFTTNTAVYRTSAAVEAGGLHEDLAYHADWFLTHSIALRHGICYVPENLAYYRMHADAYSVTKMCDGILRTKILENLVSLVVNDDNGLGDSIKEACIFPEYKLNLIPFFIMNKNARKLFTVRLFVRIIIRQIWSFIRPYCSPQFRRRLRWFLGPKLY